MALDPRHLDRTCDAALRHLDRMKDELRQVYNDHERLGSDYRNDRRFTADSRRWSDGIKDIERAIDRLRPIVQSVQRTNR